MICRVILLILSLTWLTTAEGQVKRKIKRGRRNRSEAQLVLDPGGLQLEWELGHETISDSLSTFVHPNLVFRYGLKQGTDFTLETNVLTTRQSGYSGKKNTFGVEPIQVGVDHVFLKETDRRPSLVASIQLAIPFAASSDYQASHLAPNIQLSAGRTFRQADVVTVTGGLFWDGFSTSPIYTYDLDYMMQWDKYAASLSCFGFLSSGFPQHNLDLSVVWQPNDKFQLGVTSGLGLNKEAHKNYISLSSQIGFGK